MCFGCTIRSNIIITDKPGDTPNSVQGSIFHDSQAQLLGDVGPVNTFVHPLYLCPIDCCVASITSIVERLSLLVGNWNTSI